MTKPVVSLNDGATDTVFLDVQVKGVQMDFAIGAPHPFGKSNSFSGGVHDEVFEAVEHFDAKEDPAVFGGFDRFAHPSTARSDRTRLSSPGISLRGQEL